MLFQHKLPGADPEACVFHVLVNIARAIRQGQIHDGDELVARVRTTANAFISETSTTSEVTYNGPVEETRIALSQFEPRDREILSRSYNLGHTDLQVSREMRIPLDSVTEVKKSARLRFVRKKEA